MPIPSPDIAALSRLLDEALDIDAAAREAWLSCLPSGEQHLVAKLRQMLAESDSAKRSGFLSALPVMDESPPKDDSVARPAAAFDEQTEVSPFLKAPLLELMARLARRR